MSKIHILLGLVTLLGVAIVVWWEWNQRTSPGPLHPSHIQLVRLQGTAGCKACHGEQNVQMAGACEVCHQDIKRQRDQVVGVHGLLKRTQAENCASCHTDHTGSKVPLVSDRSFLAAVATDLKSFNHSSTMKFALTGRHAALKCVQCHLNANAPSLAEGQKRFLGLSQACATCHKDIHEGSFGQNCDACHGQKQAFKKIDGFVHTKLFPLIDVHAKSKCADCHQKSGPTSVKASFGVMGAVRACVECHKDPHEGAYGLDCASCHGTTTPFKVVPTFKHTAAFPLIGGHSNLACIKCHEKNGPNSVVSLKESNKAVRGCAECHATPHRPAMVTAIAKSLPNKKQEACTACHQQSDASFLFPVVTMTARQHEATGFPLDKPHDKIDCAACHAAIGKRKKLDPGAGLGDRFTALYPGRVPDDCAKCHADVHRGQFDAGASHGRCVVCHSATTFKPNNFDFTMHKQTKFPLDGAHQAVACVNCHKAEKEVVKFVGTVSACASCHADVHHGAFDAPGRPKTVGDKVGCARCHSADSFSKITWTAKDHDVWTSYKLVGRHAMASCVDCHKRNAPGKDVVRTLGFAPKSCNECHVDPHAGQFAKDKVTDCARCHSDAGLFKETTFDHQRDSAFKLDKQHVNLACAACHREVEVAPKVKVVRYLPLGKQCQDCHDPRPAKKESP